MKQRGRKSRASLTVVGAPRLLSTISPATSDNPPPPIPDLEEPELEIWRDIVAEYKGPRASYRILADALKARQTARQAREIIDDEGMTVTGRDGQTKAHPLLAVERSATASYQRQLKALGIKF
jgi:P27 family predicted phage terminase small subunit